MGEMIKIKSTAADGFEFGALQPPRQGGAAAGSIVIQEIFGIDQYVRADVERWASVGYEAVAPVTCTTARSRLRVGHDDDGMAGHRRHGEAKPEDALADIAGLHRLPEAARCGVHRRLLLWRRDRLAGRRAPGRPRGRLELLRRRGRRRRRT